jgi:hypothetical protein
LINDEEKEERARKGMDHYFQDKKWTIQIMKKTSLPAGDHR